MINDIITVISTLVMVVLVLFFTYYATRYIGKVGGIKRQSRYIEIVDRVPLAQDKSIAIIQVGEKKFLVGIASQQISLLQELDELDLVPLEAPQVQSDLINFKDIFDKLKKKDGEK